MNPTLIPDAPTPVQPLPLSVPTDVKTPDAGTTAIPAALHSNSEGRDAIPQPRNPFQPPVPPPTVSFTTTTLTSVQYANIDYTVTVNAHPTQKIDTVYLEFSYIQSGRTFNPLTANYSFYDFYAVVPGTPLVVSAPIGGGSVAQYAARFYVLYDNYTIQVSSEPLLMTVTQ